MDIPFDADKFDEIFEKSRYLLSDDLINMECIKQDTYHSILGARKGRGSDVVLVD